MELCPRGRNGGVWLLGKKGAQVQRGTITFDCFSSRPVPNEPRSIEASLWIQSNAIIPEAQLQEQSRFLPYYESVISLLWLDQRIEQDSRRRPLGGDRSYRVHGWAETLAVAEMNIWCLTYQAHLRSIARK